MNPTRAKKGALIGLALALSLALPGSALAASSQSATESLTVNFTLSITGVPTTLAYGSVNAGSRAAAPEFTYTVETNAANGLTLAVDGSDFTTSGATIAKSNRVFVVNSALPSAEQYNGGSFTKAYPTGTSNGTLLAQVDVPAGAAGGSYTGTLTLSVATNP